MTINASRTRELDINTIIRRAYQQSGLMAAEQAAGGTGWTDNASLAMDLLEVELKELQATRTLTRHVLFYELDVESGTASYPLPSSTLDVLGYGSYLPDGQTQGATPVKAIDRESYQLLSNKEATGRPSLYFPERRATLTVYLWPVPSEDATLTLQLHQLIADASNGNDTLDLERHWTSYVIWALAHRLAFAKGLPLERCAYLRARATEVMEAVSQQSQQGEPTQIVLDHTTGWSR